MQNIVEIFKYILESNIINFLIMVWLLCVLCKKFELSSILNKSVDAVEDYIEKSKSEKQNSVQKVKDAQDLMDKLPSQVEEIEKFTKQKTDVFKKQLEENTLKTIQKVENNIEKIKKIDEKKTSNAIMERSFYMSIDKAQSDIINMLKSNPDLHNKFIDESLNELEKI